MGTPQLSRTKCQEIRQLRNDGQSLRAIAREVGVALGTVSLHASEECCHGPQGTTHEEIDKVEEHRLRKQIAELRRELREALEKRVVNERFQSFVSQASRLAPHPPDWVSPKQSKHKDKAIATFLFSDWHFDEIVKPEQVEYFNEYNREIAEARLKTYFSNCVLLARDHIAGVDIEGIVFAMAGDNFSGIIHEELKETNAATFCESLLYWIEPMVAGLRMLVAEFGNVYVPVVVGNHGRLSRKPVSKNRPQDNFDWLFGHLIAREFKDDKRITFAVSESSDAHYSVYSTQYLLTHLDQFRGGSGISGSKAPLLLGAHRKLKREMAMNRHMDVMIGGHWHEFQNLGTVIINGSGKGMDEYAYQQNYSPEPPQQACWLTQPQHGVTIVAPVHCKAPDERYPAQVY